MVAIRIYAYLYSMQYASAAYLPISYSYIPIAIVLPSFLCLRTHIV